MEYDVDLPGMRVAFHTELRRGSRDGRIVEAIELCEKVGTEWMLEGSVQKCLSLFSRRIRISGILACECYPNDCSGEKVEPRLLGAELESESEQ